MFAPRHQEIRLVITDLVMPNLDGASLAGVIKRLNPAIKIIAVSGLGNTASGAPPAQSFTEFFLSKPFRPEALLTLVHELLQSKPKR